ncbi:MAG: hypothetical protein BIFFINMI_00850 [Phycisphaerae bacterium]|nr:hypothetical protein [Phycisphaerae bacterium]
MASMSLDVSPQNEPAQALYRSMGFDSTDRSADLWRMQARLALDSTQAKATHVHLG